MKEQKVDDIAMNQGPRDAGVTNMKMDEMLMDQVMAVSCGTSRVFLNEEKYESATIRGLPADLVKKGQAREMKDTLPTWSAWKNHWYQGTPRFSTVDGQ